MIGICYPCLDVYDENTMISSNSVAYLDYGDDIEKFQLHGFISLNGSNYEDLITFALHKITEIDRLRETDVSIVYKDLYNKGFNGVFISSSKIKIPGEIMYLYYKDTTRYNMYKFEISELFLDEVITTFPNGAYFDLSKSYKCDPYFNHWKWFYESIFFHAIWAIQSTIALFLFIFYRCRQSDIVQPQGGRCSRTRGALGIRWRW